MRYGQTLFGGAVAGLVIAAGTALCGAKASGYNEVTRFTESHGHAHASAAPADSRRVARIYPVTLKATANGTAATLVDRYVFPTEVLGTSLATAQATVFYNTYANVLSTATWESHPVRRLRQFPKHARCIASGEATPETWQLGYASPAIGKAWGFGTTYYIANGHGHAAAELSGKPAVQVGVYSHALAPAKAEGTCLYTAGFGGYARADATCLVDSAVIRDDVRIQDGGGTASAVSEAVVLVVGVTQSQTGYGRAHAVGTPLARIGGKGHAMAEAAATGDGLALTTGVSGVPGITSATAFGRATVFGKGSGKATGTSLATATGKVSNTRAYAKPAIAQSTLSANPYTIKQVYGTGIATANVQAITQTKITIARPHELSLFAIAKNLGVELMVKGAPADAMATASGYVERNHIVEVVEATGEAIAIGYNNVNDLVRAPASRTCIVGVTDRQVIVEVEPRQVHI